MKDALIRWFMAVNALMIRLSHGRIGTRLGTQSILILHTLGRRSGLRRSIPIAYFFHEDRYLIVESNWGKDHHADWYFNIQKQPDASIEVKGKTISVHAGFADGQEYDRLWEYVTSKHPPYLSYQKMTDRKIPIVILEPRP